MRIYWPVPQHWAWRGLRRKHDLLLPFITTRHGPQKIIQPLYCVTSQRTRDCVIALPSNGPCADTENTAPLLSRISVYWLAAYQWVNTSFTAVIQFLSPKREHHLKMFENKFIRKIFACMGNKLNSERRCYTMRSFTIYRPHFVLWGYVNKKYTINCKHNSEDSK